MKIAFALSFLVVVFVSDVLLKVFVELDNTAFVAILAFALIGALLIPSHSRIRTLKGLGCEVELAEKRIDDAADRGLARIREEISQHTQAISELAAAAHEQGSRLGDIEQSRIKNVVGPDGLVHAVMVKPRRRS